LWWALRELDGSYRFRRQHPIGQHIVDFACAALKLAIEVDGGQHAKQEQADAESTAELTRRGYRVIRFWNNEVIENHPGVLQTVQRELELEAAKIPSPALQGGEGGAQREALGG
jgi:very-short-patch-repair endonuclease